MGGIPATDAVWTTADYALIVSLCSAVVSLFSLGWNIWAKFIHPKPKVRVKLKFAYVFNEVGELGQAVAELSVTNHGPGSVIIARTTGKISGFTNRRKRILFRGFSNWPSSAQLEMVAGASRLPTRLDQGETFQLHFPVETLTNNNISKVGFVDSFEREILAATSGRGLPRVARGQA